MCHHCVIVVLTLSLAPDRLFEMSKYERARSHQSASTSHELSFGGKDQSKPAWDAAMFGPSGLLPGQTHTPTRIGRDLHELIAQPDQEMPPGRIPSTCFYNSKSTRRNTLLDD